MRRLPILLALLCGPLFAIHAPAADPPNKPTPAGLWLGTVKIGVIELRVAYQLSEQEGKWGGKLISLDQGRVELPLKAVTFADGKLTLDMGDDTGGATFEGKLNDKGDAIVGELKQLGQVHKLTLGRIEKLPASNRPQTPKGPFPYPSEDVAFENKEAKIVLAGTLTLPKGDGPFPAVVLVSGSGPQDRDETLFDHKPFLVLADHFARNGIACLRYDDREVGKSKGRFVGATTADFATDAYSAVQFLKGRKEIDAKRIGICGHSEGGLIAPLVAAEHPTEVAFIILLAGPGVSGERILYQQALDFSKQLDPTTTEADVKEQMEAVMPVLRAAKTTAEAKEKLTTALMPLVAKEKDEAKRKEAEKALPASVDRLADPWMRWFACHDPAPTLEKVKCPVLAVNGEKDLQVKAKDNLGGIESALKKGGNKAFKCVEFKGLNHLFQTCKTGLLSEYANIEETMAPEVLKALTEWINERK